ncbi:hypothetical protein K431DRAFT_294233 [Polychaeton citri CBS 116435]|uniref:Uncharacterized protein n=1 Tax=Polychaeton citri CBS 116435 TaxID=1314669 RepID=A0A9P4QAN3_9PEZI|nr:hypothetical protein K431DRAFT_294233 [Polychaeton citri CBS 116435]
MCIIEKKTYLRSGGRREAYEKAHYCGRNGPNRLCSRTEYRDGGEVRIEEVRPSSSSGNTERSEGEYFVTQGANGKERFYRLVARKNSQKRRSNPTADSSPRSSGDLRSSPTFQRVKPEAPSPPPAAPATPRRTSPDYPPTLPDEPQPFKEAVDGTAIYNRPPSMDMPRAADNERPRRKLSLRDPPVVGDSSGRRPGSTRRPSNIVIDTKLRTRERPAQETPSSSNITSPGLSRLPKVSDMFAPQEDLAKIDLPTSRSDLDRARGDQEGFRRRKGKERQRPETENDDFFLQDPLAESAAAAIRQKLTRETLLHQREPSSDSKDTKEDKRAIERRLTLEAEARQAKREQAKADDRRSRMRQMQIAAAEEEQSWRESDAQARLRIQYQIVTPTSPQSSASYRPQQTPAEMYPSSPTSIRSPTVPTKPAVHYYPSTRRGSTLRERGEEVLAREQARDAIRQATQAMESTAINDDEFDYERDAVIDEYVYPITSQSAGQYRSKKERKGKEREERRKEFFK